MARRQRREREGGGREKHKLSLKIKMKRKYLYLALSLQMEVNVRPLQEGHTNSTRSKGFTVSTDCTDQTLWKPFLDLKGWGVGRGQGKSITSRQTAQ